jgi:multimeric flavodoxin WrbA
MKIVVVHGQSHKGSTYHLTRLLLDRFAENGAEICEFTLNDLPPCRGCFTCFTRGEQYCPHREAAGPVIEALEAADVIVAESPTYCLGMAGQLKIFFDHMAYRWMAHRPHPTMGNKIGVAVSTTAGMGAGRVTRDIKRQLFYWGVGKIYRLPVAVSAKSWDEVKPEIKIKLAAKAKKMSQRVIKNMGRVKPDLKSRFIFALMIMQQKKNDWNTVDKKHWQDQGWI